MRSAKEGVGFLDAAGGERWLSYTAAFECVGRAIHGSKWTGNEILVATMRDRRKRHSLIARCWEAERVLISLLRSGQILATLQPDRGGEEIPIGAAAWPDPDAWNGIRQTRTLWWNVSGYAKPRRGEPLLRRGDDTLWPFVSNAISGYLQIDRAALNKAVKKFLPGLRAASGISTPDRSPGCFSQTVIDAWYANWVATNEAAGNIPSRDDDWEAAKKALGEGASRESVRKARREIAPTEWRKGGPPRSGK